MIFYSRTFPTSKKKKSACPVKEETTINLYHKVLSDLNFGFFSNPMIQPLPLIITSWLHNVHAVFGDYLSKLRLSC